MPILPRARLALSCVLLLGACGLVPDATTSGLSVPQRLVNADAGRPVRWPDPDWWRGFGSAELDRLMRQAIAANNDIAAAAARVRQADAQMRIAGSALLPIVDLNFSTARQQSRILTGGSASTARISTPQSLSLAASYEVDLWGANRAGLEAAQQNLASNRFAVGTVVLTTEASVGNTYFQLLAAEEQLAIQRANVAAADRVLRVLRDRMAVGTATGLDVAQQETLLANQRAQIPVFEQLREQSRNSLATLLGIPPQEVRVSGGEFNRIIVPVVNAGLSSELLARRPDVLSAEFTLAAANANVVVARAALYPQITLTATGGFSSTRLTDLVRPEAVVFSLLAGLVQPVFHGGALRAQVALSQAQAEELLATYRGAILAALVDAENALVALRQTTEQEQLQREAVVAAQRAYDIAQEQFNAGTIDVVTLLITQQSLFNARNTLAQARLARLQAGIGLFRALGGGWGTPR